MPLGFSLPPLCSVCPPTMAWVPLVTTCLSCECPPASKLRLCSGKPAGPPVHGHVLPHAPLPSGPHSGHLLGGVWGERRHVRLLSQLPGLGPPVSSPEELRLLDRRAFPGTPQCMQSSTLHAGRLSSARWGPDTEECQTAGPQAARQER